MNYRALKLVNMRFWEYKTADAQKFMWQKFEDVIKKEWIQKSCTKVSTSFSLDRIAPDCLAMTVRLESSEVEGSEHGEEGVTISIKTVNLDVVLSAWSNSWDWEGD